ncbi:MAG: IclR family transcriptional regulator [Burkholderiaceae bacterium]
MSEISKTADQMLTVLELVAERGPITPTEIARQLAQHRPVVHRALETLYRRGLVRRSSLGYLPGISLLHIARRVEPLLLSISQPVLAELARQLGETAILTVPDGDYAVLAAQALGGGEHFMRIQFDLGFRHSLASGAGGRAILAFAEHPLLERLDMEGPDPRLLQRQLTEVRKTGYAYSHDELSPNVQGVSAPVRQHRQVVASIGIVLPSSRMTDLETVAHAVVEAARAISRKL